MSYKYAIVIYWSELDKTFIAEAPELPGCVTNGSTYAESLKNIRKMIENWVSKAA